MYILVPDNPVRDGSISTVCMFGNGSWLAETFNTNVRRMGICVQNGKYHNYYNSINHLITNFQIFSF